jgi:holo-[acyl-carrier protein] synthase
MPAPPAPLIGIDLIEPQRLQERLERTPSLRETLFTDQEVAYCEAQPQAHLHLAARFCAKEAVMKAFGLDGWDPLDVEIVGGGPDVTIELHGAMAERANQLGVTVSVSMTHLEALVGAVALAVPRGSLAET